MKQKIKFIVMVFGLTTSFLSSMNLSAGPNKTLTDAIDGNGDTINCMNSFVNVCYKKANGDVVNGSRDF
jgi:hypothetical protein